jgi:hypothetical protein
VKVRRCRATVRFNISIESSQVDRLFYRFHAPRRKEVESDLKIIRTDIPCLLARDVFVMMEMSSKQLETT